MVLYDRTFNCDIVSSFMLTPLSTHHTSASYTARDENEGVDDDNQVYH